MLHVTNGDVVAARLAEAGLPGRVSVWADVLHDGPLLGGLADEEWRDERARFLAASGYAESEASARRQLEAWDHHLTTGLDEDEVVLWLEHDLFDQLLLVRHLAWFDRQDRRPERLTLVCIDRHAEVPDFAGLGQLSARQLGGLFPVRSPIGEAETALARATWAALTSPDPTSVERLLGGNTAPLPFLDGALRRQLEEFPSVRNGLPRTEQRLLEALAGGPRHGVDLFRAVQRTEERIHMGDASFFARLRDLATGDAPLVEAAGAMPTALPEFGLAAWRTSALGRQVVEGRGDWIHWNGIDRWIGGVHLLGRDAAWRWDATFGRLRNLAGTHGVRHR
jgi:hypothetical protein